MQGKDDIFHTDLFLPLIADVERLVGAKYPGGPQGTGGISFRVLADHARAVTFLLLDGVYPSNEGRGFVLRRILRRAVRHAWLLGRRSRHWWSWCRGGVDCRRHIPSWSQSNGHIMDVVQRKRRISTRTIEAGLAAARADPRLRDASTSPATKRSSSSTLSDFRSTSPS